MSKESEIYLLNSTPLIVVYSKETTMCFTVIKSPFGFLYPIVSNPFLMFLIGYYFTMTFLLLLYGVLK